MKEAAQTEQEMRDADVPTPKNSAELVEYIYSLVNRPHEYGTCVYAMSMAAVSAFNLVAHQLGVTGFQASCADLDIIRRTRSLKGPFMIDGHDMLYPQYDLHARLEEAIQKWKKWAKEEAKKLLAAQATGDKMSQASDSVTAHWEMLAAMELPEEEKGE